MKKIIAIILSVTLTVGMIATYTNPHKINAKENLSMLESYDLCNESSSSEITKNTRANNVTITETELYNNDFSKSQIIGWNISNTDTKVVDLDGNNVLSFTRGTNSYITYYGTKFEANKTYNISCKIYVENDTSFRLYNDRANTTGNAVYELKTAKAGEWTNYAITITPTADFTNPSTYFGIMDSNTQVYIDDVVIKEQKEVVVPTDHTGTVETVDGNMIYNGDFSISDGTGFNLNGNVVKDGMLEITQSYVQKGVEVTGGNKYRLTYYIWVCDANNLVYDMFFTGQGGSPEGKWKDKIFSYDKIENSTHTTSIQSNTNGWQKVSFEWTAKESGYAQFGLKIYSGEGKVYIDDMSMIDITLKKKMDVQASIVGLQEADGYWYITFNIPENEIQDETIKKQSGECNIYVDGTAFLTRFNFGSLTFATFSGVTDIINSGKTIKIPKEIELSLDNYDVTVDFGKEITLEKLGDEYGIYTTIHNYPDGDNKFYFNIDNGSKYTLSSTTKAFKVKIDGKDTELKVGDELKDVGIYDIERVEKNEKFLQRIILYKNGDANADNVIDLKDLVETKKFEIDKSSSNEAGKYAADINRSGNVDGTDARGLRKALSGAGELTKTKQESALNGVMPIIGYNGPDYDTSRTSKNLPESYVTDDIFSQIKDLGFNTVLFNRNDVSIDLSWLGKQQLELSEKYGIKAFMNDTQVSSPEGGGTPLSSTDDLENRNAIYDVYKSFGGYYICDEPLIKNPTIGSQNRPLISSFTTQLGYMKEYTNINSWYNLFPIISGTLGWSMQRNLNGVNRDNYKEYMQAALDSGVDMLSYDFYLRDNDGKNEDMGNFYKNIDEMRTMSISTGVPFMAFVQAGSFFENEKQNVDQSKLTTVQEMFLEASAPLAMGAKGINYFYLMQTLNNSYKKDGSIDLYRSGLINVEGNPNHGENNNPDYDYYAAAKKINTFIANADEVLMNSDSKGIISTDTNVTENINNAGDKLTSYGNVSSVKGNNALVGCFDYYGKSAYMVVNTSIDSETTITLEIESNQKYSYTDMDCTTKSGNGTLTLNIPAGECVMVVM